VYRCVYFYSSIVYTLKTPLFMKWTAAQLALAASIYFGRNGKNYPVEELASITNAIYELTRLGDPADLSLALDFIDFAFKGEKWEILQPDAKEDLQLLVGKALYHSTK
jgi:hypothetical protein